MPQDQTRPEPTPLGSITRADGYDAVLFDKDGTLFGFDATWALFCERMFDGIEAALGAPDPARRAALADVAGYLPETGSFRVGALIVGGTADEVLDAWCALLPELELATLEAINRAVIEDLPATPTCDLGAVMAALRGQGMLLGVATNDYEQGALVQLDQVGARGLFDFICGSDSGYGAKPGPGMIEGFCARHGVAADRVIFVGDSLHDMDCGRNAGAGLTVAVLTGPAREADLAPHADLVLASIADLPGWLAAQA